MTLFKLGKSTGINTTAIKKLALMALVSPICLLSLTFGTQAQAEGGLLWDTYQGQANKFFSQGKPREALALYEASYEEIKALPQTDRRFLITLSGLAKMHKEVGKVDKKHQEEEFALSEKLYREFYQILEKEKPTHPESMARVLDEIADLYIAQQKLPQAQALLKQALDLRERSFPANSPQLKNSLKAMAGYFDATGDHIRATAFREQAAADSTGSDLSSMASGSSSYYSSLTSSSTSSPTSSSYSYGISDTSSTSSSPYSYSSTGTTTTTTSSPYDTAANAVSTLAGNMAGDSKMAQYMNFLSQTVNAVKSGSTATTSSPYSTASYTSSSYYDTSAATASTSTASSPYSYVSSTDTSSSSSPYSYSDYSITPSSATSAVSTTTSVESPYGIADTPTSTPTYGITDTGQATIAASADAAPSTYSYSSTPTTTDPSSALSSTTDYSSMMTTTPTTPSATVDPYAPTTPPAVTSTSSIPMTSTLIASTPPNTNKSALKSLMKSNLTPANAAKTVNATMKLIKILKTTGL